ncbi:hypothetical protein [Halodurantibacterium flavum]|uniref:Uncharacterized protein n=1 Tax=Halodurantibacterium flavum TaxID=1382802 RepID=A0ABW4S8T0_9RHOB
MQRMERASSLAIRARGHIEADGLRGNELIRWFERAGPSDVCSRSGKWRCRCYGVETAATTPEAAIIAWCDAIDSLCDELIGEPSR